MDSTLDLLWLRVPPIRYVSPPACVFEASGSGSSGPIIVVEQQPLNKVTGLRVENCTLFWEPLSSSAPTFCYNIYRSVVGDGVYEVFVECVNENSFPVSDSACYRVSAITSEGESDLSDAVCVECGLIPPPPTPTAPEVETEAASDVGDDQAELNGQANPNNGDTSVYFEWGLTTSYGNQTIPQNIGSGSEFVEFSDTITGLVGATEYHFRAVATNSEGTVFGSDQSFTTSGFNPNFPTTFGGLVAWWKADSLSQSDGTTVDPWLDSSGNNNTLTQAIALSRPVFKTGIVNGKPVVRFDGSDDHLLTTNAISFLSTDGFTYVVVMAQLTHSGASIGAHIGPVGGFLIHNAFGTGTVNLAGNTGVAGSDPFSVAQTSFKAAFAKRAAPTTATFRENLADKNTDASSVGATEVTMIGARASATLNFLNGDIAEILIYDETRTDAECDSIFTNYLQLKYNL